MTAEQVEQDALQCWDLFRAHCREEVRNEECMPSIEVWVHAYAAGVELGRMSERDACAVLADAWGAGLVGNAIRAREGMDDELEDAE